MAAHAPYIMPDGRSLQHYLHQEREREQLRRRKAEIRGKDAQFAQLLRQRASAANEHELAELKAVEAAGVRRRRRWLNEKTLRDLAGPLSAGDMEAQFKPAPFGWTGHMRPLTQAMQTPEAAALWDNFRSIDPDKEARVLAKWAEHTRQQQPGGAGSSQQRDSAPLRQRPPPSRAGVALQRWAGVGRKARTALKRANPSSVLQLELQILDFMEQAAPGEQLLLPLEDPFARLLVHGLADFYGLLSATRGSASGQGGGGGTHVAVYRRVRPAQLPVGASPPSLPPRSPSVGTGADRVSGSGPGAGGSTGPSPARGAVVGASPARGAVVGASPARGAGAGPRTPGEAGPEPSPSPGRRAVAGGSPAGGRTRTVSAGRGRGEAAAGSPVAAVAQEHEVTCTDILLCMAETGEGGLNQEALRRYVATHIHGTEAEGGGGHHGRQGAGQREAAAGGR